jgi:plastocyanin
MRPRRLILSLALLSPLAFASPAMAVDTSVRVFDFEFLARSVSVDVGDTVTWNFEAAGHTSTSDSGQPERWNSGPNNELSAVGTRFAHTFDTPGRYSYICIPHPFMKGVVVVGTDERSRSYSKFKQVRRGRKIIFRFTLVEPAKVVAKLRGASRRSATRRRLAPGSYSIAFPRLAAGAYRGTVTFTDDFDKKTVARSSTVIR